MIYKALRTFTHILFFTFALSFQTAWGETSETNEITSISKVGTGAEAATVSAQSFGEVSSEKVAQLIHEAEATGTDTMVASDHDAATCPTRPRLCS